MTDASEHLAPVSYLPWATPGVTPAGGADATEQPDAASPSDAASPERTSGSGRAERTRGGERAGRVSEFGPARRSVRGSSSGRFARPDGVSARERELEERELGAEREAVLETGQQRDDRIDRLVVSRLRRSALSVSEVRKVLAEHGLDEIEIDEWIERYERLGYLDDARLAEQLVHVNSERRGKGSGAIVQELTRRGIGAEAAREAISELDPETEFDNARTTAERRARQLRGLDRQTAERRLSAFLQRRGYGGDVVRQVVTEVLSADGS
ncbi:regulatory protein RecX [Agromyces allii]|uniref:Regulatory protein RecX n=1 Tax=Agromyces allii TaxID=393607 RepID=A0ABN2Q8Z0_9MICO|nr:regulatory protein RecX [Agromyces allii]